jgi:DNA-binding protein HU-beta
MNKNDIIRKLAKETGMSQPQATMAVEGIVSILTRAFERGDNIELRNFGTFKVILRKEKKARDISRKSTVTIPARHTVKFELSKTLKEAINQG